MRKHIVALVLCGLMVFAGNTPLLAADIATDDLEFISPLMETINHYTVDLSIDTAGSAKIVTMVQGFSGITNRVKISAKLQKYVGGDWVTVETFTAEKDSWLMSTEDSCKVSKGYSYRVQANVYAYSDTLSEMRIVTSNEVHY